MKKEKLDFNQSSEILKNYINPRQYYFIMKHSLGEEGLFFKNKVIEIGNIINTMSLLMDQDGKGDKAIVYLHYFSTVGYDWYLTEKDAKSKGSLCFGLVKGNETELGYIDVNELKENNIELDLHFKPQRLGKLKEELKEYEREENIFGNRISTSMYEP